MKHNTKLMLGGLGFSVIFLLLTGSSKRRTKFMGTIAELAENELHRWKNLNENMSAAAPLLRAYWQATGSPYPGHKAHWSAAFISWLANIDSPGSLVGSGSHMGYASAAKAGEGQYRVLDPHVPLQKGDIILRNRAGGHFTLENIGHGFAPTHADIVTKLSDTFARAIGGNKEGDTVAAEYYPIANGVLNDPRAIAILRKES